MGLFSSRRDIMLKLFYCHIGKLSDKAFSRLWEECDSDFRQRLLRIRREDDQKRSLCGRALAKKLLSQFSGLPEKGILLSEAPGGKPFAENLPFSFSISHSGDYAICAAGDQNVGADIQIIKPISPFIVRKFGSPEENRQLFGEAAPTPTLVKHLNQDPAALAQWYRLWTAKEAYGKWEGSGISSSLLREDLLPLLEKDKLFALVPPLDPDYLCTVVAKEKACPMEEIFF